MEYNPLDVTNFPMLGYRIIAGVGLGYRLEYNSFGEWVEVMDATDYFACLEAMYADMKYAHEDRWGTD